MAEGGGGEAVEEEPRAAGPRPPSARDLQVRRAVRRGNVWGRSGRELLQTRPGTELGLRGSPPGGTPGRGVGRNECRRPAVSGVPAAFPLHPSCLLRSSC